MINLQKVGSGFVSIAVMGAAVISPVSANYDLSIQGNGTRSDNSISVQADNSTVVKQANTTDISNDINIDNNTGHNSTSGNTGSDVSIQTGDADATVAITNVAGSNIADIGGCGCENGDVKVNVSGNGSRSDNDVSLDLNKSTAVYQNNDTNIDNNVAIDNTTGYNKTSDNTSGNSAHDQNWWDTYMKDNRDKYNDYMKNHNKNYSWNDFYMDRLHRNNHDYTNSDTSGDVSIDTGDASSDVTLKNMGGYNFVSL